MENGLILYFLGILIGFAMGCGVNSCKNKEEKTTPPKKSHIDDYKAFRG